MAARSSTRRPARKLFHKIGEVCEITKTEPYVLRYWESEFPFLAPEKNSAGQRIYSDEDIQTVIAIKRLLYEEGYTTAGARRRLEQVREEGRAPGEEAGPVGGSATGEAPGEREQASAAPAHEAAVRAPATQAAAPDADQALRRALRDVRDGLAEVRAVLAGQAPAERARKRADAPKPAAPKPAAAKRGVKPKGRVRSS